MNKPECTCAQQNQWAYVCNKKINKMSYSQVLNANCCLRFPFFDVLCVFLLGVLSHWFQGNIMSSACVLCRWNQKLSTRMDRLNYYNRGVASGRDVSLVYCRSETDEARSLCLSMCYPDMKMINGITLFQ